MQKSGHFYLVLTVPADWHFEMLPVAELNLMLEEEQPVLEEMIDLSLAEIGYRPYLNQHSMFYFHRPKWWELADEGGFR